MNAYKDENGVSTMIGVDASDGVTITRILANPANNSLKVADNTTGSDLGPENALKDENGVSTLMAVSSVDGFTPVPLYVDSDGNLLIDSN